MAVFLGGLLAVFEGIDFLFSGLSTLIEVGEVLDVAGLGETAFEFGEGELALFSDFGSDSAELGASIKRGADTVSQVAKTGKRVVEAGQTVYDWVTGEEEEVQ